MSFLREIGEFGEDIFQFGGDIFQASGQSQLAKAEYNEAVAERIKVNSQLAIQDAAARRKAKEQQMKFVQNFAFIAMGAIVFFYLVNLVLKYKK
jgi:hypothetical protein